MIPALATLDGETANPMLPAGYDLLLTLVPIMMIALIAASLVSIARHSDGLSPLATAVWSAVVLLAPLLGPAAWVLIGRAQVRQSRLDVTTKSR
ncbi:PLDc N-terminal domain-containing protein [Microcella daejeonensis]|uniref:PLDc N-terminal domain-containing protein n=1 Tax=Microcella daejeonensis TaxID=2994971 RepID=A0A9E8S8W3_9MICO|nr:PLDc N-terminal domain-containing protein [Microcella daejeonensis]WAB81319.1 PLDc N-terminal domain-containing protein [Microcella daejeonensis]